MIVVHILSRKKIRGTKSSLRSPLARLYPTESDTFLQHCVYKINDNGYYIILLTLAG